MSESTKAATSSYAEADPKLYAFLDWMEQQDPDYAKAFRAYGEKGTGEGQALPIKYREMVMTAILVFSGRRETHTGLTNTYLPWRLRLLPPCPELQRLLLDRTAARLS